MIACPRCQRPNGSRARCLYCGEPLPRSDAGSREAGSDDALRRLREELGPEGLAALPGALRRSLLDAVPTPAPAPSPAGRAPTEPDPPAGAPPPPSAAPRPSVPASPSAAAATPAPASGAVPAAAPALLRGRGPFGRRRVPARLILAPRPHYARGLPWLRLRLARTLGLDAYTAGMLLQRDVPALLREFPSLEEARARALTLSEAGIVTVVLTPEVAHPYAEPIPVRALDLAPSRARLHGPDGPIEIAAGQVVRLVLGEIRPPPGGPIAREARGPLRTRRSWLEPRLLSEIQAPYWLADLHLEDGPPALRIRADAFDYGCLGDARGISAWHNLGAVIARLREALGDFLVDRGFRKAAGSGDPPPPGAEEGDSAPHPVPEEVAFTEYGMLLDLCARAAEADPDAAGESP